MLDGAQSRADADAAAVSCAASASASSTAAITLEEKKPSGEQVRLLTEPGADSSCSSSSSSGGGGGGGNLEGQQAQIQQAATATSPAAATPTTAMIDAGAPSAAGRTRHPFGELGARGGGGNNGGGDSNAGGAADHGGNGNVPPCGNRDFVLTKERMAAVGCYLRENDPLFIRANLSKLREGTLKRLAVGDTVKVARRCRGENKVGGDGSVMAVLPLFFYSIKYVDGTEHGVDACFVDKIELGSKKRKSGSSRCLTCNSFKSECTCEEHEEQAAAVAAVAEAKKRWVPPPPSPPSPAARSSPTAAATDPFPRVQGQKQAPSFKRPRPAWSASQEQEEGEGDEEDEKVGEQRGRGYKSANDTDGGAWQVPIQTADDDRQRGDSNRTRTGREISDGESAGAVCVGRDDGADAGPEKSSRPRDGDAAASDVNGDGDDLPHQETVARDSDGGGCGVDGGGGSGSSQEDPGEESSQPAARDGWRPRKRDLVEVERRMTPGVNKPGGTARVVRVDAATGAVDVRYVVEGGWERGIDPRYVSLATLELNEKRSTLGRCIHCGSLRVDCRQECEFFTAPAPHLPPFYLSGNFADGSEEDEGRLGRDAGKTKRRWRESERERERERLRHRRRRRHRRPRRPSEGGSGDAVDRAGQRSESQKRRRRLPEDCDGEGDPVLGSSQEAKEGARDGDSSDDDADSDAPTRGNGQQRSSRLDRRLADSSSGSSRGWMVDQIRTVPEAGPIATPMPSF
ncbi:unnamed protein product [Pylaiella littoralis]